MTLWEREQSPVSKTEKVDPLILPTNTDVFIQQAGIGKAILIFDSCEMSGCLAPVYRRFF